MNVEPKKEPFVGSKCLLRAHCRHCIQMMVEHYSALLMLHEYPVVAGQIMLEYSVVHAIFVIDCCVYNGDCRSFRFRWISAVADQKFGRYETKHNTQVIQ